MATQEVSLGALTLQPGRQLLADGRPVPLGRKSLEILSALASAGGELVTKDELMEAVWPGLVVEENAIQAHMVVLRKALGKEAERLTTVRGFGYRLAVPEADVGPVLQPRGQQDHASIAVLPFSNLTGDPAMDYLADGIAEELICTLSRSTDLMVPARTSTFAYKGRDADIRTIARELGVSTALEGSVRRAGERIRITAQLIDATDGFHLWSANYDRDLEDLIALQDEIARAIAATLRSQLAGSRRRTTNTKAFELYLRARSLTNSGNLLRAIELFEETIALDPQYADARVGLCRALIYACSFGLLPLAKYFEAHEQAGKACELDPNDAAAQAMFGCCCAHLGDWTTGGRHFERAIALNDADPDFRCPYGGGFLRFTGRIAASEAHSWRARELAPASAMANVICAGPAQIRGRYDVAREHIAVAVELGFPETINPIPWFRSIDASARGDYDEACRHMLRGWTHLLEKEGARTVQAIYDALAGRGPRAEAVTGLEGLIARAAAEQWIGRYFAFSSCLLEWALLLDERRLAHAVTDLVVASFEATGVLDIPAPVCFWAPGREQLRQDPHFDDFFEKIGLKAYWGVFGPPDV